MLRLVLSLRLSRNVFVQVSETRQLKEEEELKLAESAENMAKLYFKIDCLRTQQGYRYALHCLPSPPGCQEFPARLPLCVFGPG